jgi:hypothetical protein
MAVSAVYFTGASRAVSHKSGRTYTAATSGLLTVPFSDSLNVEGISSQYPLEYLTGTTADRLSLNAAFRVQPPPPRLMFYDTTLSLATYYVGGLSSSGWFDYQANVV